MTRPIFQKLPPWFDASDRTLRRQLSGLSGQGLVKRYLPFVILPKGGKPFPIWHITDDGRKALASYYDDRTLLGKGDLPRRHLLEHHLGIADFHVDFRLAIDNQNTYELINWINETDQIATPHGESIRLFTEFSRKPRLVCAADFAFLLKLQMPDGQTRIKAYFGEFDRHTTQSATRIAREKAPGYAELARRGCHRQYWPHEDITEKNFTVLFITTGGPKWRSSVRSAFSKSQRPDLFRLACREDLTKPDTLLSAPVFYDCRDEVPKALLRFAESDRDAQS